ncbi:hypothetical protein ROTAS13_03936 [Roseomonas sp. TAS13]|nr:hypothetical protein ROTAS13_03936 [Roseomonas sp. TAS13]
MTRSARSASVAIQPAARPSAVSAPRCWSRRCQSGPSRSWERAKSASSSSPIRGDFSSAASCRSSSGSSSTSQSASRSCTAICSTSAMRSTPPTATPRRLSWRTRSSVSRVRRRTRIMMSPGRIGRSPRAGRVSCRTMWSMRAARVSASSASASCATTGWLGTNQGSGSSVLPRASRGQTSTLPAWPARSGKWRSGSPSGRTTPARAAPSWKTASTSCRTGAQERKLTSSATGWKLPPACRTCCEKRASQVAKPCASAPWKP